MHKLEYYKDKKGEWRWRLIATNGKIVAESGESYKRRNNAKTGAASAKKGFNKHQTING